jgi:hypothetical protein
MFFSEQEESYGQQQQGEPAQDQHQNSPDDTLDFIEETIEGSLTEAEKRLEKAQFYKAVMKGGFFGQNQSHLAKEVETEIRRFATERMNILLGISQVPQAVKEAKMPFTDQEIGILKKIIETAMKRFGGGNGPPVVTPVAVQPVVEQVHLVQTAPNPNPQPRQNAQVKRPVGRPRKFVETPGAIPTPTKEQMEHIMRQQGQQAQMMAPQVILTESKG